MTPTREQVRTWVENRIQTAQAIAESDSGDPQFSRGFMSREVEFYRAALDAMDVEGESMNTCGTCKHWGDAKDAGQTYRKCMAMVHGVKVYVDNGDDDVAIIISRARDKEGPYPFRPTDAITSSSYVEDASDYYAALKCREDFGCVSWEATNGQG